MFPFSTVIDVCRGVGALVFTFSPSATAVALSEDSTSGCVNVCTARTTFSWSVVSSAKPSSPSIRFWNTRPLGSPNAKRAYERHGARVDVLAAALRDLDVVRDHVHDLRQRGEPDVRLDLVLERLHELLLARDAVEVAVGVPVADVVERAAAVQLLVPGPEVDRRVAGRAAVVVEVAAVDVDPGAAEAVDDLAEAAEVDRDQVVDRDAREPTDGVERSLLLAGHVRVRDLVRERRAARAVDLDEHVAREREQRDRVGLRVGAHEHQRVRARRRPLAVGDAEVVSDDERDGGLAGERSGELARGLLHRRGLRRDGRDRLVEVEICASRGAGGEHEHGEAEEESDASEQPRAGPPRAFRLAVERHGRGDPRREDGLAASVELRPASETSFQGGSHEGVG